MVGVSVGTTGNNDGRGLFCARTPTASRPSQPIGEPRPDRDQGRVGLRNSWAAASCKPARTVAWRRRNGFAVWIRRGPWEDQLENVDALLFRMRRETGRRTSIVHSGARNAFRETRPQLGTLGLGSRGPPAHNRRAELEPRITPGSPNTRQGRAAAPPRPSLDTKRPGDGDERFSSRRFLEFPLREVRATRSGRRSPVGDPPLPCSRTVLTVAVGPPSPDCRGGADDGGRRRRTERVELVFLKTRNATP